MREDQRGQIEVVLVSPRNPLNIGAAARAMANFGFRRLSVVAPFEEHWREAKSAVGAKALLQNAKRVERLAEAVTDCSLVLGTAAVMHRKPEQPVVALPALAPLVGREIKRGGRVALVFGPEKRGLTREDLSYCHRLVEIPTDRRQPSMNLGQAVAVCLYELAGRLSGTGADRSIGSHLGDKGKNVARMGHPFDGHSESEGDDSAPATARDLELLAEVVEDTMLAANYSPPAMRNANRHDVHLMLRRLALTRRDARRILGYLRRILWQFKKFSERSRTDRCL